MSIKEESASVEQPAEARGAALSRRGMLKSAGATIAALGLLGASSLGRAKSAYAGEQELKMTTGGNGGVKPRIVLVHGAWADGTGWQHIIPLLEQYDYPVIAVQNPLTSIADDVANTKRVIDAESLLGPVVVVGHSYGGVTMSGAAAGNPNVKALVYLAAFAPEAGEVAAAYLEQYPSALGTALVPDAAGYLYIDRSKFRDVFASDVDRVEARVMAATQKPINSHIFGESLAAAAWHDIPSWYLVSKNDNTINPDLQRFYAQRMGARTEEIRASHVAFISQPRDIVRFINKAIRSLR